MLRIVENELAQVVQFFIVFRGAHTQKITKQQRNSNATDTSQRVTKER